MRRIWKTIRSFIFWEYERGSLQYDVMVTLILAFIFLAPLRIDFKDKPVERNPHQTVVVVQPDGQGGLVYQVEAAAVTGSGDVAIEAALLRVIEPIAGEVTIVRREPVYDHSGRISAYKVWVSK
ncbi:MAG: hypothetical protein L0099_09115 [Acidobacteria bacterium]|nr:hypothetical protein [Acidobacteriota bacterium]